jgi:enoyl-CoA hydratase/carnithine racemase
MTTTLEYTVDRRIATIRFTRPDHMNSITDEMLDDLFAALDKVRADEQLRALVLTGTGKAFSVGLDLKLLECGFSDLDYWSGVLVRLNHFLLALEDLPVPVLAKINGLARAGGYELTLACDLALMADEARIGDVHSPFGVPPGGGASFRLARRVGDQRAREIIFTGRWLTGREAAELGLVLRSVPGRELDEATETLLAQLRNKPRGAMSVAKRMLNANRTGAGRSAVDTELGAFMDWARHDPLSSEGMRAFVEKRQPVWEVTAEG